MLVEGAQGGQTAEHAEHAVVVAAAWNGVGVRTHRDGLESGIGARAAADHVADRIFPNLEAGRAHLPDEPVARRAVGRGVRDPIVAAGRRPADLANGREVAAEPFPVEKSGQL